VRCTRPAAGASCSARQLLLYRRRTGLRTNLVILSTRRTANADARYDLAMCLNSNNQTSRVRGEKTCPLVLSFDGSC
jgi:hypothetical protein